MSERKSTGFFSNWSTLEYGLLALFIVLLCGGAVLAALLVGGFMVKKDIAGAADIAPTSAQAQAATTGQATEGADVSLEPTPTAGQPAAQAAADDGPTLSLSTPASAPGTTVTLQGEGWPAGSRIIITLVPSEPPTYAVNSAIVDQDGRFAVEMIVPSDARWLEESPVPVLAATESGLSAQTSLTIVAGPDSQPVATPAASTKVIVVAAVLEPNQPPPPQTAPQLTTTANLNVRSGPGTTYSILGVLRLGQQAEIIGRNDNATWWQIKFPGAASGFGWVSAEYAQAVNIGNVPIVKAQPAPAQPAPTPTPPPGLVITDWRGEYYNNRDLQGSPALVRNDVAISFDWGLGSPDSRLPNDSFSARWSRAANFSAGTYRFYARVDDGVRLWVDNSLLINEWKEQSPTTYAADIYLTEGAHNLVLEYNELTGGATAILSWDRVDTYPDWKAEYYGNPDLQGAPVLVRNEGSINYNWGAGSPAPGLPADNFSIRWSRTSYFDSGDYLFRIISDDGQRVYFDNDLVLDNWRDGLTPVLEARRNVPAGLHQIRVEYYERGGDALIGFSWQRTDRQQLGPQAIIRTSDTGLVGQPVKFNGRRSRPGDSAIDKYDWDFGDGSSARGDQVSHTYRSPGNYQVRLTVTDKNGLRDRTGTRVKIERDLQATTSPLAVLDGPSTGTTGDAINFSGQRSQSVSPIVDYRWNFGDGTTGRGQAVSHNFSRSGHYSVILTVIADNGLRSSDNLIVRIDDSLTGAEAPVARISAPRQGQTSQPVTFDATQSSSSLPLVSWQWSFGDGANANGPTVPHSYGALGSYNVTLTVTDQNGQSNSANQVITIADPPAANQPPVPAISGPSQAIAGQAITFNGSGSQSSNPITGYNWDFGDGNTAAGPQVNYTYSQVGDFTVTLSVTDDKGQQASASQAVNVAPQPQPDPLTAKISGPTQGQVAQALSFDGQSSTSAAPLNSIQWDFGDGNTASGSLTVNYAYQNPGSYTVLLTLANDLGQNNTTSQQVTIQDAPAANTPPQPAIQADATTVAAGDTINFDASGTAASAPIASYEWDFGDGAAGSGQLVSHDFAQPGSYNVTLTVTDQNGQIATASQSLTVNPKAQPEPLTANINAPASATVGQPDTFDGQQSTSAGPLTSVQWDFGDGATGGGTSLSDLVIDHTYQQPGNYTVQLTLANELNQTNTASFDITVQPAAPALAQLPASPATDQQLQPPTAEIEGPSQALVGETVVFDGGFSQASSPIVAYQWGFGDGLTASGMGVTYAYGAPGMYNVTLNVTDENGLSSSASHIIEIVGDTAEQPAPQPAQPEVEPAQPAAPEPQPTAPPAPQQPVEQLAPAQPPTAVIDGPRQVQAGVAVDFSGLNSQPGSSAITDYQWGFGDGATDNQAEVTHVFPAASQYQVTLTVVDENGLSHTAQLLVSAGPSQAEIEAQQQAEEAQRQAEEAQRQAEIEAQQQAEEAQRQAEIQAQRQAEEAQQQAEQQAQAEAQRQAEEAQRQAEIEAQRQAEEAQRQAEIEAQRQAEEEAQRQAEEAQRQAEEEARRQAEEEAQRQAEEEAQRQAEKKARRQAEEAQQQAQDQEQQQQDASPDDASSEGN